MSRRTPNAAAERAAQNAQTIKSLLKLEWNKTCADCKRNKHPRWASWNLGVFICIRCSGIHRGMGTHISRVKSVDLDSWTDEQLQSALKWGNLKANKYWEAKLATGHVPSESKMENFIRTKYESKRWVMEGPMPDPSTLEVDGDDDVPLSLVKEKQTIERSASQRGQNQGPSQIKRAPQPDLFGDNASPKASAASKTVAKMDPTPVKQTKPADSLLGLDFFGTEISPPSRPSSAMQSLGSQSRPDLKQSILSLYASTTRPQQQPPPQNSQRAFGSMQSVTSPPSRKTSFGVMNDAFSSFNLSNQNSAQIQSPSKTSSFMKLGNDSNQRKPSTQSSSSIGTGTFFDTKSSPTHTQQPCNGNNFSSSFGAFESVKSTPSTTNTASMSSGLGEMFDFAAPAPQTSAQKPIIVSPAAASTSVFNLSQTSQNKVSSPPAIPNAWSTNDAWGANNAWGDTKKSTTETQSITSQSKSEDPGWGSPVQSPAKPNTVIGERIGNGLVPTSAPPKIKADEDFGSWSSAAPVASESSIAVAKPAAGFAGNDDLFSNVWG